MFGNRCPKCSETFEGSFFSAAPDEIRLSCSRCNTEYAARDDFPRLEIRIGSAIFFGSFVVIFLIGGLLFGWNKPWTLLSAASAGAMVATIALREAVFWLVPSKYWLSPTEPIEHIVHMPNR